MRSLPRVRVLSVRRASLVCEFSGGLEPRNEEDDSVCCEVKKSSDSSSETAFPDLELPRLKLSS